MAITLKRHLTGRRNAPLPWEWSDIRDDAGVPIDLTAAEDVRMQVRLHGAALGAPLASLTGVGIPLAEGLLPGLGSLRGFIDEATLALLPQGAPGESARFKFDVLFDFAGVVPEVWIEGDLVVDYGVTDRLGLRTTDEGDARVTDDGSYRTAE